MVVWKVNAFVAQSTVTAPESDYGSDFDEETWENVFSQAETQPLSEVAITSIEESQLPEHNAAEDVQTRILRMPRIGAQSPARHEHLRNHSVEVESEKQQHPEPESAAQGISCEQRTAYKIEAAVIEAAPNTTGHNGSQAGAGVAAPSFNDCRAEEGPRLLEDDVRERSTSVQPEGTDTRSPLQRFRTSPKKPLSVTDIISPAWCELQYWHSLTKYGRIRKTPAMKQGSKIHKEKEREVHTEVPVATTYKEDRFGLRLWNIILGLRTLRLTGLTRELEVVGLIDGEVIVGIIDEISQTCPDEEMEALVLLADESKDSTTSGKAGKRRRQKRKSVPVFPADQSTMNDFPVSSQESNSGRHASSWLGSLQNESKSLYIVDIKTRQSKTLPPTGSQMRPTRMQLMLYRRLLIELTTSKVAADKIFDRYGLESSKVFSDAFIAAMSGVMSNTNEQHAASADDEEPRDPLDEITSNNTLESLWTFMISEFAKTLPASALSPLLAVEYRASDTGAVLGKRCFGFSAEELDAYVESEMQWWRGHRAARGVDIEDAYKCGICEFAEKCEWRREKVEEAARKSGVRRASVQAPAKDTR